MHGALRRIDHCFVLAVALYVAAAALLLPPLPGNIDTHAYKDAGVSLALGQGLTSVFNFGNPTLDRAIFAGYPPGFGLLYGAYAGVAGVGARSNELFEQATAGIVILLVWLALRRTAATPLARVALCLLLLGALPARFVLMARDRPDVAGMILALAALLVAARPGAVRRSLGSALLAGAALLVSPLCGLLACFGVASTWFCQPAERRLPFTTMLWIGPLGALLPLGGTLLVLQSLDSSYLARLGGYVTAVGADNVAGMTSGVGALLSLLSGNWDAWWDSFRGGFNTIHHWVQFALLIIALSGLSACLIAARPVLERRLAPGLLALWCAAVLAAIVVPWSKLYAATAAGYLLCVVAVALPAAAWQRGAARRLLLGTLALMVAVQLPLAGQSLLIQAALGGSYQRMVARLADLPLDDRTGDGEVLVELDPFAYFLFRERAVIIVPASHPLASDPALLARADYVVLSYPGSGDPLEPHRPPWWAAAAGEYELLYRPALPQQPRAFGVTLSRSSATWEVEIWGRRR